jgi:hypothetical protein
MQYGQTTIAKRFRSRPGANAYRHPSLPGGNDPEALGLSIGYFNRRTL